MITIKHMHKVIKFAFEKEGIKITDHELVTYKRGEMIEAYLLYLKCCMYLGIDSNPEKQVL